MLHIKPHETLFVFRKPVAVNRADSTRVALVYRVIARQKYTTILRYA